jgi:hypothetical protein
MGTPKEEATRKVREVKSNLSNLFYSHLQCVLITEILHIIIIRQVPLTCKISNEVSPCEIERSSSIRQ